MSEFQVSEDCLNGEYFRKFNIDLNLKSIFKIIKILSYLKKLKIADFFNSPFPKWYTLKTFFYGEYFYRKKNSKLSFAFMLPTLTLLFLIAAILDFYIILLATKLLFRRCATCTPTFLRN